MSVELFSKLDTSLRGMGGIEYFNELVLGLNQVFNFDYAFIGRLNPDKKTITTISVASNNKLIDNFTYNLLNSPCEKIMRDEYCCYNRGVFNDFPKDKMLREMKIEGYVGYPLKSGKKLPIGILVLLTKRPIEDLELNFKLLKFFAQSCEIQLSQMKQ